jgi:hypothetical protein
VCDVRPIGRAARVALWVRFRFARKRQDGDNGLKALQDSLAWALDFDDAQIAELHVIVERGSGVGALPPGADVQLAWGADAPAAGAWPRGASTGNGQASLTTIRRAHAGA